MAKGVWMKHYAEMWEHHKVDDFLGELEKHVAEEYHDVLMAFGPILCCSMVMRLNGHLLKAHSPDGVFRAKNARRFLAVVWPECDPECLGIPLSRIGDVMLLCLTESGWLHGTHGAYRLHGYEEINSEILRGRAKREDGRAKATGSSRDNHGGSTGQSRDNHGKIAPDKKEKEKEKKKKKGTPIGVPPPGAAEASETPPGDTPLKWIAQTWMDTATALDTRWVRHPKVPAAQIPSAQARWKEVPDKGLWKIAMERAARDGWWAGKDRSERTGKFWRANLESFLREAHFHRWITEAKEDWRSDLSTEDLAWGRWTEAIENGEFTREEFLFPGTWPDANEHDAKTYDILEKSLREWWHENIWRFSQ